MTRQLQASSNETTSSALGLSLRRLRTEKELPLWKVAAAAKMDSALLSKIELGQRLPTPEQTAALAAFFRVAVTELEGMRMAEKFLSDNGHNPAAVALALARIQEGTGEYRVNTKRAIASKSSKSVNRSKRKG